MDYTKEICENFNLKNYHLVDADKEEIKKLKEIDLVISSISWGFHYPVSTYIEEVNSILKPGGLLIFIGFRDEKGLELLHKYFDNIGDFCFKKK